MSFKVLFFFPLLKLGIALFLNVAGFNLSAQAQDFSKNIPCFKDIKSYSPHFLTGQLTAKQQNRLFHCLWGVLDLIVEKKFVLPADTQDYFSKEDIFSFFNFYLKYDQKQSHKITNFILVTKKLLVGGSIEKLKIQELDWIFRLIYDYEMAYYSLHKQLPLLIQAFKTKPSITTTQNQELLDQFKKAFEKLRLAYQRENVIYHLQPWDHYRGNKKTKALFSLGHNLLEGLLFPKTNIQGQSWTVLFNKIHQALKLFLYYKTHSNNNLKPIETRYLQLESLNLFLDLINKGFPVKSLDRVLLSALELLESSSSSNSSFLSRLKNKDRMAVITRSLICFSSINPSLQDSKNCQVDWDPSLSQVSFSFPDSQFTLSQTKQLKKISQTNKDFFLSSTKVQALQKWLEDYKQGIQHLYYGLAEETALKYQFDHWLDPFFGWELDSMTFGSFHSSPSEDKSFQLLQYQALLSLFLESHGGQGFFSSPNKKLPIKTVTQILLELYPVLSLLFDIPAYNTEIKKTLLGLFSLADQFLNSSNHDQNLSAKELLDLTVHLFSATQQSQKAFKEISQHCHNKDLPKCSAQQIIENPLLLSAYPRFKEYIFKETKSSYHEKIHKALESLDAQTFSSRDFLALFFLIQIMETNFHLLDHNQNFKLESHELLSLAHTFKSSEVFISIPFISNEEQALSYIMYSFKTGEIPFFTGTALEPVQFAQWYFQKEHQKPFDITANDFHFLIFDLYNLSKQF